MKLERWALMAEVVSSIAIVVTLGVLIYETRQNTAATYSTSYDRLSADLADWRMTVATNPIAQQAYGSLLTEDPEDIAEEVLIRAQNVVTAQFQIYERAYLARRYGRLGDQEWGRFYRNMCFGISRDVWPAMDGNLFSEAFTQYMAECAPDL